MPSLSHYLTPSPGGDHDLRHLSPEQQGELLRSLEAAHRTQGTIDRHVYLLSQRAHEVLAALGQTNLGLHDVDGTHTTVGGWRLHEENLKALEEANASGMWNAAVTGRHRGQVEETIANHPGRRPFQEWLFEQGFFIRREDGRVETFEGSDAIAHNVEAVRSLLSPYLPGLQEMYGVRFETTSQWGERERYSRAHETMYSLDVLDHEGKKISADTHRQISRHMEQLWRDQDPNHRIATPGSSSHGVIEFTPDGLNKGTSVLSYLNERNIPAKRAIYLGDSSNDVAVTADNPDLPFIAIVNNHTHDGIIRGADIATVGVANAVPILERLTRARRAAETIVVG